jgi:hypothetical protein
MHIPLMDKEKNKTNGVVFYSFALSELKQIHDGGCAFWNSPV